MQIGMSGLGRMGANMVLPRCSVIASWLFDLTAAALAAVEEGVPAQVLAASLYERFESRGLAEFQNKMLSAMRFAFGGHLEKEVGS